MVPPTPTVPQQQLEGGGVRRALYCSAKIQHIYSKFEMSLWDCITKATLICQQNVAVIIEVVAVVFIRRLS
jgi:hypothetical protein